MSRLCLPTSPAVVFLSVGPLAAKPAELPLATHGRALASVVLSGMASPGTKLVAAELAGYLGQITGAKFEVVTGDGSKGIVLGTLAEFPNPALAEPLAIRNTFDGREASAIQTEPARVLLIGATDLGGSHAAFRILEALGCRWFFAAKEWEVIPSKKTLTVSVEETDRPRILARRIWYGYEFFADTGHPAKGSTRDDYDAWARHNRMALEVEPLVSRELVGELFRDLEEATKQAKDRPDVLARLDHMKHYLRYVHLRWLLDYEKDKDRRKDLTVAVLRHCYRTRYAYMTHWAAIRNTWAAQAAKEFGEPTWVPSDKAPKPWAVDQPVTREETDAGFREGLGYFRPKPIEQVNFSNDLVPVAFPAAKPVALKQQFQRPAEYALHSSTGEPLDVTITPGIIAWYRDRPDARYTLKDAAGKVVAEGKLALDGEPHRVSMTVPTAGTYRFECNDSSAGWGIAVEAGRPAVLLSNRGRRYLHLGQLQETFFYVPKGTKEVQYFWRGGPHRVLGPDRKPLADVTASDEIVTVVVPAGADGRVWSFTPYGHGHLWLFNVPNVLAASPDALLLPKELVTKDGLPTPKK